MVQQALVDWGLETHPFQGRAQGTGPGSFFGIGEIIGVDAGSRDVERVRLAFSVDQDVLKDRVRQADSKPLRC
jgi:hypothetical protein